jgi:ATP-dependent DNA helicase PIF1
MSDNRIEQEKIKDFADWILNIGDGKSSIDDEDELIQIAEDLLLHKGDDAKETIVQSTYPDLLSKYREREYLQERAILYPKNNTVDQINEYIMSKLQGGEVTYLSSDSVCSA